MPESAAAQLHRILHLIPHLADGELHPLAEVAAKAREAAAHVVVMQSLEAQAQADKDEVVRLVADRKAANTEAKAAKQADRKKLE